MAASILLVPEPQFCDADGKPYAGGSIATFVPGTTTGKATWRDPAQSAFNSNPIILDAAGRCRMWGDGDYRLILYDAAGNLIWDAPSTTIVSAAMAPVVSAPTIEDARHLLGLDDIIDAEAAARAAADAAEQAAREAADATEKAAREAADADLQSQLDAEIARAEAAEAALSAAMFGGKPQYGGQWTDSTGHGSVTFATPYTTTPTVVTDVVGGTFDLISTTVQPTTTGFDIYCAFPMSSGVTPAGVRFFTWIAVGT